MLYTTENRQHLRTWAAPALLMFIVIALGVTPTGAATFAVNSNNDADDGACNTSHCSLREAINAANAAAGADAITFLVGGGGAQTIAPATPLPAITGTVTIDGATQPGFSGSPLIQLSGANAGADADGLRIQTAGCTITKLVINRFSGAGVRFLTSAATANRVVGNFIGTDTTGTSALGNRIGVAAVSAPGNFVGGIAAADRNIISGNSSSGIQIQGSTASGNRVQGNFIGTANNGTTAIGNGTVNGNGADGPFAGVVVDNAPNNTIGGTTVAERNLIAGNNGHGVVITGSAATGNRVLGNFIGTNAGGTAALANLSSGVSMDGAGNNTVGGALAGTSNPRNIISGNGGDGVKISGGTGSNVVQGNFIGTDVSGTLKVGNGLVGIRIVDAPNCTIGGPVTGTSNLRNIISGNGALGRTDSGQGIRISGSMASGNRVQGNFIGLKANGTEALGNAGDGVTISGAPNNLVGGTTAAERNFIGGNLTPAVAPGDGNGVAILGDAATGNLVQGNFIGTNSAGTAAVGNGLAGVNITGPNYVVGGPVTATSNPRNLISGNAGGGITISGVGAGGNRVQGNLIGTSLSGGDALPNGTRSGVIIAGASNNVVGGTTAGERNIISGNNRAGIEITGSTASGNRVQGNFLGTKANGLEALKHVTK